MVELSNDAKKLLYLLSLYTGGRSESRWIKNYALWVLVYYGIVKGVFDEYDYAPTIVMWHGAFRVVNVSMEAERDLLRLRQKGLIEKLRLATSKYRYVTAYRVSDRGLEEVEKIPLELKRQVDQLYKPGGENLLEVVFDKRYVPYLKHPDGHLEKVDILEAEDVPYESKPAYL